MFKEDEEYKKRLEEARRLRQSVGMVTANDTEYENNTLSTHQNAIDNDYINKLAEAKKLRNSVGMITSNDLEEQTNVLDSIDKIEEINSTEQLHNQQEQLYSNDNILNGQYEKTAQDIAAGINTLFDKRSKYEKMSEEEKSQFNEFVEKLSTKGKFGENIANGLVQEYTKRNEIHNLSEEEMMGILQKNEVQQNLIDKLHMDTPYDSAGRTVENTWLGLKHSFEDAGLYIDTMLSGYKTEENKKGMRVLLSEELTDEEKKAYLAHLYKTEGQKIFPNDDNILTSGLKNTTSGQDKIDKENKFQEFFGDKTIDEYANMYKNNKVNNALIDKIASNDPAGQLRQQEDAKIAQNIMDQKDVVSQKLAELAPSIGQMIPGTTLSVVSPVVGTGFFVTSAAGGYLRDGIDRGMTPNQAKEYATIMGILEGGSEAIITGQMANKVVKSFTGKTINKKILNSYGLNVVENILQEAVMEPAQELTAQIVAGNDKADWSNIGDRMMEAGLDGGLMGIVCNGATHALVQAGKAYNKLKNGEKLSISDIRNVLKEHTKQFGHDMTQKVFNEGANDTYNRLSEIIYNPENTKSKNDMDTFYISKFDQNGNFEQIIPTKGKEIENINSKLMINPVIVKNADSQAYQVIDGATGVVLDNSYYNNMTEAENAYNDKVKNLSEAQIQEINKTINETTYNIHNNINDVVARLYDYMQEEDKINTNNVDSQITSENKKSDNLNKEATNYTPDKVKSITEQFKTQTEYTKNEMADIWNEKVDANNSNVIYDNDGKIKSYIAIEEDGNTLKISQYDNNDNIVQSETISPQDGKYTADSINNAIEKVTGVYEQNNKNRTPEQSKFYEDKPNYAVSNIEDIEKAFNKKKTYTLEEAYEIMQDVLEDTYDKTLDDDMFIDIDEKDGKLEAILYDGRENDYIYDTFPEVNKVEIEKNKDGKYTAKAINDAIKEVATMPNESSPIQGQIDVEGNVVSEINNKDDIYSMKIQLKQHIQDAIQNKNSTGKTYLGYISDKVKNKIKTLLNIDVLGRKHVLADNDIRHMLNEHGNAIKEKRKGQIPIDIKDIEKIPDILNNFDKIILGNDNKEGKTIRYIKKYSDNISYVVEVVPEEGNVLKIKTMWKKPVGVTNNQKIPSSTSKTKSNLSSSTSITNSIPQKNQTVKNERNTVSSKSMQNNENNTKLNPQKTNIQDFGEKIGGARKDLSGGRTVNANPGKEVIHDYTVQKTDDGYTVNFKNKQLKDGFKTQAEAEQYILDFKNSIKDNRAFVREGTNRDGETSYMIFLRNPRTLKSQSIGKVFKNKQDAESYAMALSMYLKDNGKNLLRPQIQKVERTNANNKNATKATGDDILNNFGFKGGEFGNWVTQNERQQFLNYAQDAFSDLAAALDITPESLGQQGAMSIAFGARGQGLTGAVAHFEPGKKVINMTRLKGAGSLAHEYGHSIDNYLSRVGGYDENGMATENMRNPKLSDNMKNAIKEVTDSMKYTISTNQEEIDKKNAIYEKARKESLETHLSYLDNVFNGNQTTYKYNRKTKQREQTKIQVTDEQKQKYQDIRKLLYEGKLDSKRTFTGNSLSSNSFEYSEPVESLKALYKEVVGRKINDDTVYWLYRYGQPSQQVSQIKSESAFLKSARELDKETGRATAYFSRIDEMWARAFESYISDKLKAKGIKDTYLVHSVNNNEYALFNPFPAGEERKNINKAFDNLIQTMKDEGLFTSGAIPQNFDEDTGIRYMKKNTSKATDNQGRILTKQQQKYFKDSKIRDENGNLETVYHGTLNYGFTEFEGGHWGANYYTNNKNVAESYFINSSKTNGIYEGYLNITKPLEVDMQGRNWSEIRRSFITDKEILDLIDQDFGKPYDIFSTTDVIIATKKSGKYDGVIFKNIYDDASSRKINLGNDYVTFNSNQFKNIDNQNPTSNSDIRYMKKSKNKKIIDSNGNTLSQQQQEYFKNSKLRNSKNELEIVYHTTPNVFTEFNDSMLGDNTLYDNTAFGHFVTTNKEFSQRFGDIDNKGIKNHTMEMYANVEKPITHPYNAHYKYNENELDNIVIKYFEAIDETEGLKQLKDFAQEEESSLYDTYMNMTIDNDLFDNASEEKDILKKKGYDAVEFVEGLESELVENSKSNEPISSYAIFNSKQLKNIDNTNPTSDSDIRFAKRSAKETNEKLRNAERGESYIEQEIQKIEKTGEWDNSIPVTKLSDIRKTIEDYLGLGIKKGHFRQDAYAIYKGNNDVIRTKEYKDIDSILHETGHAMDLGKRLNVDKESIADELFTAIDKLGGYETESKTIRLEEGFAEVIREYSIIPEQAKKDYPQTVAILEGLKQTDNKFNKFITTVQKQAYNYIHQNPRNRTLSNVSIGEQTDKQNITKNFIKQEVMRNIYDKDWAVKSAVNEIAKANGMTANQIKASENAYYLTRLAAGTTDKVISMLSDGYIDENGKKLFPGLNQIGDILGNDTERWNDLRTYLVARRDLDYKAKTLKTGIRTMDSKAVIEQFKNDKPIQQAAKLVYDTLDGVMKYAVNNGLVSQETADKLKQSNAFYVPMQRVLDNRGNQVGRRGAVADIIKKRTGSELDVKDVLENIIANSSNIIQLVENNNILKALYKEGKNAGITGTIFDVIDTPLTKIGTAQLSTWENELKKQGVNTQDLDLNKTIDLFAPNNKIDTKNLITSFINENGKRIYLQFNDEILFNSLMNMDKKFMSQVLKINSKLNMPLRYGATMANLGFAIPNMISDTAQAAVYSTAGFIPVVDNALGVLDILASQNNTVKNFLNKVAPGYAQRINNLYSLYQQSGATNSTRLSQYRESTQKLMADVYGTKSKTLGIKEKYKPLKRLLDILTYIPEISEQSTRFRVFEKNYDYYKKKGTAETDARILAALESRDATQDFGRTGNITREINQLIPFSAARVGSAYTFAEKIKANPKQVGMRIALLTTIALAIKGLGYDDDEIEELIQRKKDDNFVLRSGDQIVTIKKPQGILRSMINLAEYIQDLATGHIEEGKEGERLSNWLNNAIMDNMPADEVTGLVPNAVAPIIENAINKDLYYNTDIVKSYDQDLPDAEQYYDYNSQLAIWLGKIFNYSPAKIDNLISGYFGGLGTTTTSAIDYALGKAGVIPEKPEMGAEQDAIGKRFVVNVNTNSSSINEIYERKTELTKLKNGGTITSEEENELKKINAAISNMSDLNKQIKEIKKGSLSGTEKAEKIKVLQQEKTDTARQALGKNLINSSNASKIQSTQFYPNDTLKNNGYTLTLNSSQKKEYEQLANAYYTKYAKQGLYSEKKLDDIKTKAKDYAKAQMFKKYKSSLVKTKK